MLCLQKNRGRNWGIFDPNDFLKLFLKRMDFNSSRRLELIEEPLITGKEPEQALMEAF